MSTHRFACVVLATLVGSSSGGAAERASRSLEKICVAAQAPRFETATGKAFHPFGVNYYRPGTGWAPQVWKQFDAAATRRDFARLKELGGNCVRVFLTFGSFYMEPGKLSQEGLASFDRFLELAEEAGLYVHPTGPDHWEGLPEWARSDRYADDSFLKALESFWKQFAARYRGRPVIFAYDLLNEPSVPWDTPALRRKWRHWLQEKYETPAALAAAWPRDNRELSWETIPIPAPEESADPAALRDYQSFRESVAVEWTRRQAAAIKAADPQALVTVGLIQWSVPVVLPGVQHYSAFRPDRLAPYLDFLEVHFYPLARGAYEYQGPEEEERNLAYLQSVVREVARPGRPVVVAEFGWYGGAHKPTFDGGRHPAAGEAQQARWCRQVVTSTAGLATGWLNWGFHDQPEARDVSQQTGLLTADGQLKEWGRVFQELSGMLPALMPKPDSGQDGPVLEWDVCVNRAAARQTFAEDYLRHFREKTKRNSSP